MRQHRDGKFTPEDDAYDHEYCIIFGAATQAERTFTAGCYFYALK
nr:MAG TPA: hypothetical protein [Caudoviricetes sp.]